VAHQPNADLDSLTVEVSRSHTVTQTHTHTHTHTIKSLWTSYQPVADSATCTTHNTHDWRNPCLRRDSNPNSSKQAVFKTYPLDRTVTGVGW